MGQKVNPISFRLGINENWKSRWFATKEFADFLAEDIEIRKYIGNKLIRAAILKVEIERAGDRVKVNIHTARPGIVIGKRGSEVDLLREELEKLTGKHIQVNIQEVSRPETMAVLISQGIAEQLVARVAFRRAMKKAVFAAMKSGAQGIRVACAGRLGGAEMSRTEWYREGRVPLHTLRARIDYGFTEAQTTFGKIGVKVWVYKGEVLESSMLPPEEAELGPITPRRPKDASTRPGARGPRRVVKQKEKRGAPAGTDEVKAEAKPAEKKETTVKAKPTEKREAQKAGGSPKKEGDKSSVDKKVKAKSEDTEKTSKDSKTKEVKNKKNEDESKDRDE